MFQSMKTRLLVGAPFASAIVFGLMTFMGSAVAAEFTLANDREIRELPALPLPVDKMPEPKPDLSPFDPDIVNAPPELPPLEGPVAEFPDVIIVSVPAPRDSLPTGDLGDLSPRTVQIGERIARPIVRPQPVYPARALRDGLSGSCDVRFSLTTGGIPFDVVADCSDPVFAREAKKSVERARFAPEVRGGQQIESHGLVYPLVFETED